jgi:CubicO group peptidase (beta-lactamase class C family)
MDAHRVPGAVVVIVRDGTVLFAKGYGYADLASRAPVDPAVTLFRPGSVSKLFTWTAVMQLVEAGKLDLNADVNTYLDFSIPATYPQPVTLRHLLAHTPGFEDRGDGLFKLDPAQVSSLEVYLKTHLPARVFPPGEVGAYSNYGSALAGYIVERVSGVPFEQYIQQHILQPLGMRHATFQQPLPPALAADMASGYNFVSGEYVRGGFEYVVPAPAGALSASGLDMARFMIAHLQDGEYNGARILSAAAAQQMHTPLDTPDERLQGGLAHGFFYNIRNGQYTLSHGGDTMLFHSNLLLLPESQTGLFVSTNGTAGALVAEQVVEAFIDRYYPPPAAQSLVPSADFADRAGQYAGAYHLSRSNFTTFEKVTRLFMPVSVWLTEDQRVMVNMGGSPTAFIETEPGLLVDAEHPDNRLVLKQDGGQVSLVPAMPFVFFKTPWHGRFELHLFILIGGALLFLIALIAWVVSFIKGLRLRQPRPLPARLARLTGGLFALVFLGFLVVFGALLGTVDPAYGVPAVFFGAPPALDVLLQMPLLLAVLGALMLVFAVAAWFKGYWNAGARLAYSLLALFALAVVWSLAYWNLLSL